MPMLRPAQAPTPVHAPQYTELERPFVVPADCLRVDQGGLGAEIHAAQNQAVTVGRQIVTKQRGAS